MSNYKNIVPVILCGGSGTRLWPMSREKMPKQFLKLLGGESLLQQTAKRALGCSGAPDDRLVCVTLAASRNEVEQQLCEISPDMAQNVLSEPMARDTSAAVALAANYVHSRFGADSVMWILPADHYVGDEEELRSSLMKAANIASSGYLVTFGIKPKRPETGYGYIRVADKISDNGVFNVERFVEKPNLEIAKKYVDSGNYLWNSGMFVFEAGTIMDSFFDLSKETMLKVRKAVSSSACDLDRPSLEIYKTIDKEPFDKSIMEKSGKVAVVPTDPEWSDIGSWESLWEIRNKDAGGNAVNGQVAIYDSKNCMVHSEELLVACAGLENIVVVETGDAVLIADKSNSDAMKVLVNSLKKTGRKETVDPVKENRSWGTRKVLHEGDNYKIREVNLLPGEKTSLQMHSHRNEMWMVVEGEASITTGHMKKTVRKYETILIKDHSIHRLANEGSENLKLIEIQYGRYVGEDDTVRFDAAGGDEKGSVAEEIAEKKEVA